MGSQLAERHPAPNRQAIVEDVQIAALEVHDAFSRGVLDIGIADIPFLWDRPVEHLCTARNLMKYQRNGVLDDAQALPNTIAGDAPADRIKHLHYGISLLALFQRVDVFHHIAQVFSQRSNIVRRLAHCYIFVNRTRTRRRLWKGAASTLPK